MRHVLLISIGVVSLTIIGMEDASFWCCQGTGLETNTKYMDSIYGFDKTSLFVNLFIPSKLNWKQRNVMISQATTFPQSGKLS